MLMEVVWGSRTRFYAENHQYACIKYFLYISHASVRFNSHTKGKPYNKFDSKDTMMSYL